MLLPIVLGAGSGWLAKGFWGSAHDATMYLQWGGIGLLLWATLGVAGWDVQTFSGNTSLEILNRYIYRGLHMAGTYILTFSVFWTTAARFG